MSAREVADRKKLDKEYEKKILAIDKLGLSSVGCMSELVRVYKDYDREIQKIRKRYGKSYHDDYGKRHPAKKRKR